jgi:hypothetical protein
MKLTATKSFSYNTRRLLAGDHFEAKPAHGRLLIAVKRAREQREPGKISALPKAIAEKVKPQVAKAEPPAEVIAKPVEVTSEPAAVEDLAPLREEYQAKVGKRPFMGWDAETLRAKMAEADVPAADEADVEETDEDDDETASS